MGPNYIVYQFAAPTLGVGRHLLTVVHLDSVTGIERAGVLEVPKFQVHGMRCGPRWIEIASFDAIYRVDLDTSYRPTPYSITSFPAGQIAPEFISSQLNNLGAPAGGRVRLNPVHLFIGGNGPESTFFLDVEATDVLPVETCELNVRSRIVQLARDGTQLDELVVFEGRGHRECGE